jgi:nitroimidazol reductase NimA-like FMN-containing flavoprotein (pyridoxamine 5'-phosphate oxidase superfamily)
MIFEMTERECRDLLGRTSLGRLACSQDNQPYVIPIYFAFDFDYAYSVSTLGQKIEWMRANPKVCVEVDEIADRSDWRSVVVLGTYQELTEPQYADERSHARSLLEKRSLWWQNALGERQLKSETELIQTTFFRIHVDSMTGLRATAESR